MEKNKDMELFINILKLGPEPVSRLRLEAF